MIFLSLSWFIFPRATFPFDASRLKVWFRQKHGVAWQTQSSLITKWRTAVFSLADTIKQHSSQSEKKTNYKWNDTFAEFSRISCELLLLPSLRIPDKQLDSSWINDEKKRYFYFYLSDIRKVWSNLTSPFQYVWNINRRKLKIERRRKTWEGFIENWKYQSIVIFAPCLFLSRETFIIKLFSFISLFQTKETRETEVCGFIFICESCDTCPDRTRLSGAQFFSQKKLHWMRRQNKKRRDKRSKWHWKTEKWINRENVLARNVSESPSSYRSMSHTTRAKTAVVRTEAKTSLSLFSSQIQALLLSTLYIKEGYNMGGDGK